METPKTPESNDSPKFVGLLYDPAKDPGRWPGGMVDERLENVAFADSLPDVDAKLIALFAEEASEDPATNALHESYIRIRDVRPLILMARVRAASGDAALADALTRLEEVR